VRTFNGIEEFKSLEPTVITIGTFDGVHVGHSTILRRLINSANSKGLKSAVLTFFPHPRMVLQKDSNIKLLNTLDEKKRVLDSVGLDYLIVHPFTQSFSRLSALEFVRDILVNQLQVRKIIIGYDHRFGRNRNANINDLITFGQTFGFEVEEIAAQDIDEVSVSSTKIRKALLSGDVLTANSYLGYEYMLTGIIKKGKGIGRKMGFPTANLKIQEDYKLIPENGVYTVYSLFGDKKVHGMMNIGYNPTFEEKNQSIEVHYFDFDADLYEKEIEVRFLQKIRDERKFESIELLGKQLEQDKQTCLKLIS